MSGSRISITYMKIGNTCIADYHKVSHERWANALACYRKGEYFTAMYIGGYSVECMLKYVILQSLHNKGDIPLQPFALQTIVDKDPDKYRCLSKHWLRKLIRLGNEERIFKTPKKSDLKELAEWCSEWRYATDHSQINQAIAKDFLQKAATVSQQVKREVDKKIRKIDAFEFTP